MIMIADAEASASQVEGHLEEGGTSVEEGDQLYLLQVEEAFVRA